MVLVSSADIHYAVQVRNSDDTIPAMAGRSFISNNGEELAHLPLPFGTSVCARRIWLEHIHPGHRPCLFSLEGPLFQQ